MDTRLFIIYILATFGISYIITQQNGPYHIFPRITNWLWDSRKNDVEVYYFLEHTLKGNIYNILKCPYCLGVYISFLVLIPNLILKFNLQSVLLYPIQAFGVYGGHVVISSFVLNRLDNED
jgi:hypothetical protein